MNKDEILKWNSMPDVLQRYGIHCKAGQSISCPFHGADKHPSMKIFKDGYKCFTCGESGDIFKFVQKIECCSFKDAFERLGGTYEHTTPKQRALNARRFEEEKRAQEEKRKRDQEEKKALLKDIYLWQWGKDHLKPLSDDWVYCAERLLYDLEELERRFGV